MDCVIHVVIAVHVSTPVAVHVALFEILRSILVRSQILDFSVFARVARHAQHAHNSAPSTALEGV